MNRSFLLFLFITMMALTIMNFQGIASAQDAVTSSPDIYKVLFEDETMRIIEFTLLPGKVEGWHGHPTYFFYVITGGKYSIEQANGETRNLDTNAGMNALVKPVVKHRGKNVGDTIMKAILIEMKGK